MQVYNSLDYDKGFGGNDAIMKQLICDVEIVDDVDDANNNDDYNALGDNDNDDFVKSH